MTGVIRRGRLLGSLLASRAWNWQPTMRSTIALVVLALTMSVSASVVAAIGLARTSTQVTRIDALQKTQAKSLRTSTTQARAACVRTMRLAPALVDDYARRRIFQRKYGEVEGGKRLREAQSTIPTTCRAKPATSPVKRRG